jgi:hypothetical protein
MVKYIMQARSIRRNNTQVKVFHSETKEEPVMFSSNPRRAKKE